MQRKMTDSAGSLRRHNRNFFIDSISRRVLDVLARILQNLAGEIVRAADRSFDVSLLPKSRAAVLRAGALAWSKDRPLICLLAKLGRSSAAVSAILLANMGLADRPGPSATAIRGATGETRDSLLCAFRIVLGVAGG